MQNKRKFMLAGAALAALPAVSKAAVVTFSFDMNDFYVETTTAGANLTNVKTGSTTVNGGTVVVGGTSAAPTISVPVGDYILYGLDASVTGNGTFGITAFQTGMTTSNASAGTITPGKTVVNATEFSSGTAKGTATAGSIPANLGTFGQLTLGGTTSSAGTTAGVGTPVNLYTSQIITPVATAASSLTATVTSNNTAITFAASGAPTSLGSPTYVNRLFVPVSDSVAALPSLAVTYGTPGPSGHAIVSLVNGASSDTTGNYGTTLTAATATFSPALPVAGDINVVGSNAAGYVVGKAALNTSSATANVNTAFTVTPTTGTEVYALKLLVGTVAPTSGQLTTIIADINASSATDGVVASLLTGAYAFEFPGYSIELTADALGATSNLGFDFSQETNVPGIVVTNVAAVPEPATMAGLAIGAVGLLLNRRKNRIA